MERYVGSTVTTANKTFLIRNAVFLLGEQDEENN